MTTMTVLTRLTTFRTRHLATIVLLVLMGACQPGQKKMELAGFLIDSIQSQTIPDKRVEVFDIKPVQTGDKIILKGETTSEIAYKSLIDKLERNQLVFIDSVLRLPDPALGEKNMGLVTLSVASLRYKPAHSAEMATQALMGTPLRILRQESSWYQVQTPDSYIAWIEAVALSRLSLNELKDWNSKPRVVITDDFELIYSLPDNSSPPVSDIVIGGILAQSSKNAVASFMAVNLPDGREGFIEKNKCLDLSQWFTNPTISSASLVSLGKLFLGRPYLWGGTSAKAFDCSGFTKTIYFMHGIILSRDASQQVKEGVELPVAGGWENLVPGDLLFFGRAASADSPERVGHVGMYIGDSEFIHCSGLVKINSLDSTRQNFVPYYKQNLLHAKRVIGDNYDPVTIRNHNWYN